VWTLAQRLQFFVRFRAISRRAALYPTEIPCLGNRVLAGAHSLILATLIATGAGVDVRTAANCPSAEGISERLKPLLPAAPGARGEHDVALVDVIQASPDGTTDLIIRLLRPDTSEIGNRRVSLIGTCQDVAEAVAAILAAWETDPRSEGTSADEPVAPPAKNESDNQPSMASVPLSRAPSWEVLVGAGAGAALVGGVAASGTVEVSAGKNDSHWHLRTGVAAQTARSLDLAPGHADWQHTTFAAGLIWHSLDPRWRFSFDAGPVMGWATLSGVGFSPSRQQRVFEYGGAAAVRLGRTWGRWTVWAETRATLWLQDERATVKDPGSGQVVQGRDLSSIDATASLGLSLALFR
jgi:hypothetical protein